LKVQRLTRDTRDARTIDVSLVLSLLSGHRACQEAVKIISLQNRSGFAASPGIAGGTKSEAYIAASDICHEALRGISGEQVRSRNNMEMIGSANDFAAERIYKAPAVNAFVGSSNRNQLGSLLLRASFAEGLSFFSLFFFNPLLTRLEI